MFFSLLILALVWPVMLIIAVMIKVNSRGPIFFRQARLGKFGKKFIVIKFRTMVENAEKMGTGLFNYEDDPRVTKVGRFLRKTSLDELPQLFNIMRGEMSFVGPRPPVTYELGRYEDFSDELKERFTVMPGLTGLAQIRGRNELSWDEKIKYDMEYIRLYKKWGMLIDFKIFLLTIVKVLRMEGNYERPENYERDAARMEKPLDK